RGGLPAVLGAVPDRRRPDLRRYRNPQPRPARGAAARGGLRCAGAAADHAAAGLRHQGSDLPRLGVVAGLLPHRPCPGHGSVRRHPDQGRVYAIIRTQTLLFPDSRLDGVLVVLAIATMLIGIIGAVAQEDIKRLLSFTLVSHIGYMIFGIALASDTGPAASILYLVPPITAQTAPVPTAGL